MHDEAAPPPAAPATATVIAPPPPLVRHPAAPPEASIAADPKAMVTIPLEQLQTFTAIQSRLAQLEEDTRKRDDAARSEQVKLLAAKGEVENALRIQREQAESQLNMEKTKLATVEERAKRYALEGELARTLAGYTFVSPAAARQTANELRQAFTVEAQGDSFIVRTPTFVSVADHVAAQLATPEFAHFLRSTNGGGTAGGPTSGAASPPSPPANPAAPPVPKTLGEAVILHMQSLKANASADPRFDLSAPMGLRRAK